MRFICINIIQSAGFKLVETGLKDFKLSMRNLSKPVPVPVLNNGYFLYEKKKHILELVDRLN